MSDDAPNAHFGFSELERAILDTTVTLCQQLSHTYNHAEARDYVATYLETIAGNLRALPNTVPSPQAPGTASNDTGAHKND